MQKGFCRRHRYLYMTKNDQVKNAQKKLLSVFVVNQSKRAKNSDSLQEHSDSGLFRYSDDNCYLEIRIILVEMMRKTLVSAQQVDFALVFF